MNKRRHRCSGDSARSAWPLRLSRKSADVASTRARRFAYGNHSRRRATVWTRFGVHPGPLPAVFRGDRDVEIIDDQPAKRLEWRNNRATRRIAAAAR